MMQEKHVTLEVKRGARSSSIQLDLVDGAYCAEISHVQDVYGVMLPGDTITIKYAVTSDVCKSNEKYSDTSTLKYAVSYEAKLESTFEVDYTFPESSINTPNAVKEEGTPFDRIVTYSTHGNAIPSADESMLQKLYEHVKMGMVTISEEGYMVLGMKTFFYSNYLSRLANVGKRNIILADDIIRTEKTR